MAFASATQRVGSFQVNITRLVLATIYLILLVAALRLDINLSARQILHLSLSGVVGLSLGDTFLFKAFQEIGARMSMLVMSTAPAIAAAGVLGIAVTVAGVSIVVLDRNGSEEVSMTASGLLYAILGAAGQGGGLILAKLAFREGEVNGFVATGVRILASLVLLLPAAVMTKRLSNPVRMFARERKAFLQTALGSILGPFLGISFSLMAIEYTKVGIAATIMALVPILMLPLVKFVYKERLTWRAVTGAFVAVAGVALLFLR